MQRIFTLASLLLVSFALHAQQIRLLKDIDTLTSIPNILNYEINGILPVGDTAYLQMSNDIDGTGLWINDFSPAGTRMIDRYTDYLAYGTIDFPMVIQGTQYYFALGNAEHTLRKTDGTIAGSEAITNFSNTRVIGAVPFGNDILVLSQVQDTLRLWRSDGTASGTNNVKTYVNANGPVDFAVLGSDFYFVYNGALIKSNGTTNGTLILQDLNVVGNDSVRDLTEFNGRLWFTAKDASHGAELWSTDGLVGGTQMFDNFNPLGNGVVQGRKLRVANGRLFWLSNDGGNNWGIELRSTDGTVQGSRVYDYFPGPLGIATYELVATTKHVYFNEQQSHQLCVADTAAVTRLKSMDTLQVYTGAATIGDSIFLHAAQLGPAAQLWRSDGTVAGTVDITPPFCMRVSSIASNGRSLFFVGDSFYGTGYDQLYRSDGSRLGFVSSRLFGRQPRSSATNKAVRAGNFVFFEAGDSVHGRELWRTDGTAAGTILLQDIEPGAGDGGMYAPYVWHGQVFFEGNQLQYGKELWRSDGSVSGTMMLGDIRSGSFGSSPRNFYGTDDFLFFAALDGTPGTHLYRTDGTVQGTVEVHNFNPNVFNIRSLKIIGRLASQLLIAVPTNQYDYELWIADSLGGNPTLLSTFPGEFNWTIFANAVESGNQAFFVGRNAQHRYQLWRTLGTPSTTLPFSTEFGFDRYDIFIAGAVNDNVIYRAYGSLVGTEFFVTDGTPAGTHVLLDINPGGANSSPATAVLGDSLLWFTADDGVHGSELWTTDGTTAGTQMVSDFTTGSVAPYKNAFVLEGEFYSKFRTNSYDPYSYMHSDGTLAGTGSYGATPAFTGIYDSGIHTTTALGALCSGTDGDFGENLYLLHHNQVTMLNDLTGGDPRSLYTTWALPLAGGYVVGAGTSQVGNELFFIDSLPEPPTAVSAPKSKLGTALLTAFPVPAHDLVQLRLQDTHDAIARYTLTDITGRQVRAGDVRGQTDCAVTLDGLAAGVYIARVQTRLGAAGAIKVVKE
jgi:ELWxxDGT repeat protein